ncbi:MAG: hypothetical protein RIN55_10020 [Tissierellaceae bacterium]|nr:hypothetical protein [Tissierellaceae bacterium]
MVNLVNKQVVHKSFGKGSVVDCDDSYIKINFESGEKIFVFPRAFKKHLKLIDKRAADIVNAMIKEREVEHNIELKKQNEERELKQQRLRLTQRQKAARDTKGSTSSQSVFWCNSEELERVSKEWSIFAGTIKNGENEGQPKRLSRINHNSACLLTLRNPNDPEENRSIVGVFMVNEGFYGGECIDGYIPAHPEYRILLSEEESKELLFWNYYTNKRYPNRIVWNSGRHRYFDNIWMAQILRDIINLKTEPKEQEYVKNFFEHFCNVNNINTEELSKPNGALMESQNTEEVE